MIDTSEAGAGSYPSAPESKEKCYISKILALCELEVSNYVRNRDEVDDYILEKIFDEKSLTKVIEVEKIIETKEEK